MKRKPLIILLTITIVAFFSFVPFAYSWIVKQNQKTVVIETDEFQVTILAYFGSTLITKNSPYYDQNKKVIIIDAANPMSVNYIGNFRLNFRIVSKIPARLRLKIQDEWKLTRTYRASGLVVEEALYQDGSELNPSSVEYPFLISSTFPSINNLATGYMYYNRLIEKDSIYNITYITGGKPQPVKSNPTYYENCTLYFDIIVDIVQSNRFSQVWGVPENFFS